MERMRASIWRLLVAAGNTTGDIAALTGSPRHFVDDVVHGREHPLLPATSQGRNPEPQWHRARLELRRCLDLLDRSGGPDSCWRSSGWTDRDGRAGRGSALLGTRSLARQVLMVTSGVLNPAPDLVAAHCCHDPLCANPRCLIWADRPTNADHRRLARIGAEIPQREATAVLHLDVLERSRAELEFLAVLERQLSVLVPGQTGHRGCLVRSGTEANVHYTTVRVNGRGVKLHRLMLEAAGVDLQGQLVLHHCDHPPCCRLAHLRAGTARANASDARMRDRLATGGRHGRALYDDADVARLRRQFAQPGVDLNMLRSEFGGHPATLLRAIRGETYPGARAAPVALPIGRRLTDRGVMVVRALVAIGVPDGLVAQLVGQSCGYVRGLSAGAHRPAAGGPLTAHPGPASGRRIATGKLTNYDHAYIVERLKVGVPKRQIARELAVDPRTIGRVALEYGRPQQRTDTS